MFPIGHFQCGNGPLVLGSMGHFKFQGANPASRRPRKIPGIGVHRLYDIRSLVRSNSDGTPAIQETPVHTTTVFCAAPTSFIVGSSPHEIEILINIHGG